MAHDMDGLAVTLFTVALRDRQAGELLECLFEGGTATVDINTGRLLLIPASALEDIIEGIDQ